MSSAAKLDPVAYLERFALTAFRPGQLEVISAVLAGEDCLCIMPTGGGKSLCFQLPSVAREGVTLVVSPLIALMKDQVDSLTSRGLRATYINSTLNVGEQSRRIDGMLQGNYDLVYIAPERLRNSRFAAAVRGLKVQLLAVDEAHCVSEWGHDFRPDYARLGEFRERIGFPQTIALTATATPLVRKDVARMLRLRSPRTFITGFARPNLGFEVVHPGATQEKDEMLVDIVNGTPGAGIVYAATRKGCEAIVERLRARTGRSVGAYHGGMQLDDRRRVQEAFMCDDIQVIVATNAFGMGIDKRDLRFVIHYNMPGSLEAYYQEAGRAGRDGAPSRCVLLFSYNDRYIQEFFIENGYPARHVVRAVYEYLRRLDDDPIEMTQQELKECLEAQISGEGIGACEQLLERCGALVRMDSRHNLASVLVDSDLPTLVDLLPREAKVQRKLLRAIEQEVGDQRGEWVFLRPGRIMERAGLDRDAMNRGLRELRKLEPFDYVPPFRGKAIHVVDRQRPFTDLEIDFDELERRKAAEMEKLEQVVRFARSRRCRQLEILDYFGDPDRRRCGCCDNCGGPSSTLRDVARLSSEARDAVRMALSGVARAKGRFGKQVVIQMLCGSSSAKIRKWNLDQLSTFGLLDRLTQSEANQLFDALLDAGLVVQNDVDRYRPVIDLSEEGREVMHGRVETNLDVPAALREKLERIRGPARAAGPSADGAPPELGDAERIPRESDGDSTCPGGRGPLSDARDIVTLPDSAPPHHWTWHMFSVGFNRRQCLEIRGLDESVLHDHLSRAADDGLPIRAEWVLAPRQIEELERLLRGETNPRAGSILEKCGSDLNHELVTLYLKSRQIEM